MYSRSISHESNSSDVLPEMADLVNRIASYHKLPDDIILPASEFALEGLFFTGRKDRVRCFECGVRIQGWEVGEKARKRHREASPNCPIVTEDHNHGHADLPGNKNKPQGTRGNQLETTKQRNDVPKPNGESVLIGTTNDAINAISTTTSSWYTLRDTSPEAYTPQTTDFTIESNRLGSFVSNWPQNALISPSELASAGLYFTGPGDRVQCAWCRGGLYNWEPGDTALGEHRRHFPSCQFVKNKLTELVTLPVPSPRESGASQENPLNKDKCESNVERMVQIVQDMGYSREMVLQALTQIQENSDIELTVESLFDAVFDLEEGDIDTSTNTSRSETEVEGTFLSAEGEENSTTNHTQREQRHGVDDFEKDTTEHRVEHEDIQEELDELTEANKKLKDKTLCKICLDEEVEMVFLPCRHLTCCMDCGKAVRHCPVCRTLILGHVTTSLN